MFRTANVIVDVQLHHSPRNDPTVIGLLRFSERRRNAGHILDADGTDVYHQKLSTYVGSVPGRSENINANTQRTMKDNCKTIFGRKT